MLTEADVLAAIPEGEDSAIPRELIERRLGIAKNAVVDLPYSYYLAHNAVVHRVLSKHRSVIKNPFYHLYYRKPLTKKDEVRSMSEISPTVLEAIRFEINRERMAFRSAILSSGNETLIKSARKLDELTAFYEMHGAPGGASTVAAPATGASASQIDATPKDDAKAGASPATPTAARDSNALRAGVLAMIDNRNGKLKKRDLAKAQHPMPPRDVANMLATLIAAKVIQYVKNGPQGYWERVSGSQPATPTAPVAGAPPTAPAGPV